MSNTEIIISFLYRQIPRIGRSEAVKACAFVFPCIKMEEIDAFAERLS